MVPGTAGLSKIFAHKQQEQHLWQELRAIRPRFVHGKEKSVWSQERAHSTGLASYLQGPLQNENAGFLVNQLLRISR